MKGSTLPSETQESHVIEKNIDIKEMEMDELKHTKGSTLPPETQDTFDMKEKSYILEREEVEMDELKQAIDGSDYDVHKSAFADKEKNTSSI